jgi:hypothetical protein
MFLLKSNDVKKQNFKRRSHAVGTAGTLKIKTPTLLPTGRKLHGQRQLTSSQV